MNLRSSFNFYLILLLSVALVSSQKTESSKSDENSKWRCVTGKLYIDRENLCDGQADCPDGSDETIQQCSSFSRSCLIPDVPENGTVICAPGYTDPKCADLSEGTVVKHSFRIQYKCATGLGEEVRTCNNGVWTPQSEITCSVCGRSSNATAVPQTVGGDVAEEGMFPWHAAIYEMSPDKAQFICSGTLVSNKVVITAAHCYLRERITGRGVSAANVTSWKIGLGKYFRDIHDVRDKQAEFYDVEKVIPHLLYTGSRDNFANDIALIILARPVIYSAVIQPVCLDLERQLEFDQLVLSREGLVPVWGKPRNGTVGEELLVAKIPYVDREECLSGTELYRFVTMDKICGGNLSSEPTEATLPCTGDTGAGYVFYDGTSNSFYLRGVLSVGSKFCRGDEYYLFTRVSNHERFIDEALNPRK